MLLSFTREFAFGAAGLLLLAATGGFAVTVLRRPYALLAAPLAGLGVFGVGVAGLWGIGGASFHVAAVATIAGASALTAYSFWQAGFAGGASKTGIAAVAAAATLAASILLNSAAALRIGSPAIGMGDSGEQSNYAQTADWIIANRAKHVNEPPRPDWNYERFPREMVQHEARNGAFFYLALISTLRRADAVFSYDLACAIAWAAALLGLTAVFARTPLAFGLLLIGLATVSWFDYGRNAYFGKLLAYPSILCVLGIALSGRVTSARMFAALTLTIGASTLHAGEVVALMVATIGGAFIVFDTVAARRLSKHAPLIGLMFVAAIGTTGSLIRLPRFGYPDWHLGFSYVISRALDLKNQGTVPNDLGEGAALFFVGIAFIVWLGLAACAWAQRQTEALAFLIGPLALLAAMWAAGADAAALQLMALFYAAQLCGVSLLLGPTHFNLSSQRVAIIALAVLAIAIRAPRMWLALDRYALSAPADKDYAQSELRFLTRAIGRRPVLVDTGHTDLAYLLRASLLRDGVSVQWSERGWEHSGLRHFMNTPTPTYTVAAPLLITHTTETAPNGWRLAWATTAIKAFQK